MANSWPSIVYLLFSYKYYYSGSWYTTSSLCGGTLVNRDTVITAAHCYTKSFQHSTGVTIEVTTNQYHQTIESAYSVYAGLHSSNNLNTGVKMSVKSFTVHSSYDVNSYQNDIAIIKLQSKVDLNEKIQIACIPESSSTYPKTTNIDAYIAGWGNTVSSGTVLPDFLMEAIIKIYDSSKCSSVFPRATKNWNNQICAGKYEGGVDTCQGDSGGPLYVKDTVDGKQRFVLAGVTSFGDGCAVAGKPG